MKSPFLNEKLSLFSTNTELTQEFNYADLLGREVVPLQSSQARDVLKGQVILVTGAAGSIGSELCRQLLDYEPERVIALDINETGLFDLVEEVRSHPLAARLYPKICDITDLRGLVRCLAETHPQIIFHAAAYKHVPLLEAHPDQAIRTNALATHHLCCLAREYKVARFVFVSSDKAAEPVSVLGATKRIGEMIVQSLAQMQEGVTCFCAVRFGNVIGSRGSVVPVFARQIERGGPITVTDPQATRYFMTIPEACGLVIFTAALANQGGLYLLDMGKPVRIVDLAMKMIRWYGLSEGRDVSIVYTGLRPGERLHEALVADGEVLAPVAFAQGKVMKVMQDYSIPTPSTIVQWILSLDQSLQHESNAQLRERLFEIVRVQELIATSQSSTTHALITA